MPSLLGFPKNQKPKHGAAHGLGVWGKVGRGAQGCGLVGDIGDRGTTAPDDLGGLCQP